MRDMEVLLPFGEKLQNINTFAPQYTNYLHNFQKVRSTFADLAPLGKGPYFLDLPPPQTKKNRFGKTDIELYYKLFVQLKYSISPVPILAIFGSNLDPYWIGITQIVLIGEQSSQMIFRSRIFRKFM